MKVFYCRDNFEDMMCCVYDAWASKEGHANVELKIDGQFDYELFKEYIRAECSYDKFYKVIHAVQTKISMEAYKLIYRSAMSFEKDRLDWIYRFMVDGFKEGAQIVNDYRYESVRQINKMSKKAGNESHLFLEFIRFEQIENRVLYAEIEPKCNVITMVAPHFEDRLPDESWIIFDKHRKIAAIHPAGQKYYISVLSEDDVIKIKSFCEKDEYESLWRVFFNTIGIAERENPDCQRNMLPLWYRGCMTEFKDDKKICEV